jgi:hypothetical protein
MLDGTFPGARPSQSRICAPMGGHGASTFVDSRQRFHLPYSRMKSGSDIPAIQCRGKAANRWQIVWRWTAPHFGNSGLVVLDPTASQPASIFIHSRITINLIPPNWHSWLLPTSPNTIYIGGSIDSCCKSDSGPRIARMLRGII